MRQLSLAIGKSEEYIAKACSGSFFPPLSVWQQICQQLNISLSLFLDTDESDTYAYIYSILVPLMKRCRKSSLLALEPLLDVLAEQNASTESTG